MSGAQDGGAAKSIVQLESEVALHRERLKRAEKKLLDAKIAAAPVRVGDLVTSHRYPGLLLVREVDVSWLKNPWIKASPKKKNGEWMDAARALYNDWELATPSATP